MRYTMSLALVCGLILGSTVRADDAEARKIINKAIQATGIGDGKLAAVTWKGKGTFHGMGDGIPYTGTWSQHLPDKFRMEIENAFTIVVNGDKGWFVAGGNSQEMNKEQVGEQKEAMHASWVLRLHPLKDKAFTLTLLGESKVEDKPAIGVKVSYKGRRDVTLHFDKESGLAVKLTNHVKDDMAGAEFEQESVIKEWVKVGELKVPSKMVVKRDGKVYIEAEMSEYKMAEKLPDETFAKP